MSPYRITTLLCFIILFDTIAYGLFDSSLNQLLVAHYEDFSNFKAEMKIVYDISSFLFILSPAYFLMSPFLGACSDKWGRRKILIFCYVITCLDYLLTLLALVFHLRVLIYLTATLYSINMVTLALMQATIADISQGKQRAQLMAMLFLFFIIGIGCSVEINNYIFNLKFSYFNKISLILGCGLLLETINLILVTYFIPTTNKLTLNPHIFELPNIIKIVPNMFSRDTPGNIILLLIFFIFNFGWGLTDQHIILSLTETLKINNNQAQVYVLVTLIIMLLSLLIIYKLLIRKVTTRTILFLSLASAEIGIVGACLFSSTSIAQWLFSIPLSIGLAITIPLLWTILANFAKNTYYGTVMGMGNAIWIVTWAITETLSHFTFKEDHVILPLSFSALLFALCIIILSANHKKIFNAK